MMSHLLMKEGYMGEDAARWYKQGIMADCRINGLYEAYIRALKLSPKETLLPEVVRYFAFDTPLEERYLAYVYEKILKQQEKLSSDYLNRIHNFTIKQLKKGKINSSLAYLYRNTLSVEDMDENLQLQLQKLPEVHVQHLQKNSFAQLLKNTILMLQIRKILILEKKFLMVQLILPILKVILKLVLQLVRAKHPCITQWVA